MANLDKSDVIFSLCSMRHFSTYDAKNSQKLSLIVIFIYCSQATKTIKSKKILLQSYMIAKIISMVKSGVLQKV